MADLSVIYSKTPRGLRARATLVGGLSSHQMKVLSLVDGISKAEAILLKFDNLTPETLVAELLQLEKEGYIKATGNTRPNQEWSPTVHFTPMVVEEYQSEEELEAIARAKAEQEAKLAQDRKANAEAAAQREIERKAQEEKALIQAKSKAKAEAKMKELLAAETAAKVAEELRIKAELEAKAKQEAKEKAEQEEKRLAEEKARAEAEQAKAKAETEKIEIALREAERIAKEAEEIRIKTEAEAQKKAEEARAATIEAELQAQAQQLAKTQEKEKAHLEIQRVLREAEEKRKKSAKKAKEEKLEAKKKAKLEEEAVKTQAKSKAEITLLRTTLLAEEHAKEEAQALNRMTIEKIAKEAEDARINKIEKQENNEEATANVEETLVKARLDEEEREKTLSKEKSLAEMERIAKEADALRKPATILKFAKPKKGKKEFSVTEFSVTETPNKEELAIIKMEERARREAELIAKEEQELAEIEAEEKEKEKETEKEKVNTKEFAKTIAKPVKTVKAQKTEHTEHTNQEKKQEKQEKTEKHISKPAPSFKIPTKTLKVWVFKLAKVMLVYLPLSLILLVGIAHVVNLKMLANPIAQLISEQVQDAVTVDEVRVSLLPEPHIVLGSVSIGKTNGYKIESIYVVPTRASLFENEKVIKSAFIEGMQVDQTNFAHLLQLIKNITHAKRFKVEDLHLKNIAIKIRDVDIGVFDGKLKLSETNQFGGVDLMSADNTLSLSILGTDAVNNVILHAQNWVVPLGPKVVLTKLSAKGLANQDGIDFSNISGELYGGSVNAKLLVDWSSRWQLAGSVDLAGINAAQMLTAMNSPTLVEGKLKLSGNFASVSSQSNKMFDDADMRADFVINDGSIRQVELARAIISHGEQSLMGDDTHFDKLSGSLQVKNAMYQYTKVNLQSPQFNVNAYFDVMPNQLISGKVDASLQAQSRRLQAHFTLAGTSNNVRSK